MLLILVLLLSYLLGAIPFSFIVAKRLRGIDLREHGSGNLGATNVFRTLGPWWGLLVLLLDMAKGAVAVLAMTAVTATWPGGQPTPLHLPPDLWRIFAGFVAALGHTLSPFVGFHGGKGVATTSGAFFVLAPYPTLVALGAFAIMMAITRIVSLGSIVAAIVLPIAVGYFELRSEQFSKTIFVFTLVICLWVLVKHRTNIKRLQAGTEKPLESNGLDDRTTG
ncbi:glycerol-3-phosphate 1-O-acyltransferase PlsY [bacterium]|nr:glycerol-3-phosphate 1-O-acyltransferase PlsY [bacterium]MBU1674350.1 glycerol-3-phosphate 1-O-acyltransferase PlsY [bacterium]